MRSLTAGLTLLAASLCLVSCDDAIYAKGEVLAKRKYESVKKGDSRDSVITALGIPTLELVLDKSRTKYTFRDQNGNNVELDRIRNRRASVPVELQFLPDNPSDPRILVYSTGTVFGYIGLGDDNTVSFVKVVVS